MSVQIADALMSIFGFERVTLRGRDESGKTAAHELLEVVMSDKMREDFEVWAESRGLELYCSRANLYEDEETLWAWSAWQASRAALVVELPAEFDEYDGGQAMEDCREAIHAAGVKTK